MLSLTSLGLLPGEIVTHPSFGTASPRGEVKDDLFDASERGILSSGGVT
jgi:hypothetical protein